MNKPSFILSKAAKIIISIATAAIAGATLIPVPTVAINQYGYFDDSSISDYCTLNISTCSKDNSYIPNVDFQIKDNYGNLLRFNSIYDIYSIASNGGGSTVISSDSYGEVTIELPAGAYYICPITSGQYTPIEEETYIYIQDGISSKNLDITFNNSNMSLFITFESDSGVPISGCSFSLYDSNMKQLSFFSVDGDYSLVESGKKIITANDSTIELKNLPEGNYHLIFNSMPDGMSIPDDSFPITLSNGNNDTTITLANQIGSLLLSITDINNSPVKGSICSIVGADGNILNFTKVSDTEYYYDKNSTTANIEFLNTEPILITGLPAGTSGAEYTINETTPAKGYLCANPVKVTVSGGDPTTANIAAIKSTGILSISVVDEVTEEPIAGATYTLIDAETKAPVYFSLKSTEITNSAYIYDEEGSLTAVSTGDIGIINIENLPTKKFIIKNKENPTGYIIDSADIEKEITANCTTVCDFILSKSNVAITIYDENETPIIDVPVEIYDSNGTAILNGKTNAKGKILLTNIASGTYTYRIASVPEGYSYNGAVQSFTITPSGLAENLSPITLEKATIKVGINPLKSGDSLDNAVFVLYDERGNEVLRALTSNMGVATFSGVKYGNYTIKQISAPIGYTVSDKTVSVIVNETYTNQDIINFSESDEVSTTTSIIEDKEETTKPKKAINWGGILWKVLIGLVIVGILVSCISAVVESMDKKKKQGNKENENTKPDNISSKDDISTLSTSSNPQDVKIYNPSPNSHPAEDVKIYVPKPKQKKKISVDDIDISEVSKEDLIALQKKLQSAIGTNDHSDEDLSKNTSSDEKGE